MSMGRLTPPEQRELDERTHELLDGRDVDELLAQHRERHRVARARLAGTDCPRRSVRRALQLAIAVVVAASLLKLTLTLADDPPAAAQAAEAIVDLELEAAAIAQLGARE